MFGAREIWNDLISFSIAVSSPHFGLAARESRPGEENPYWQPSPQPSPQGEREFSDGIGFGWDN